MIDRAGGRGSLHLDIDRLSRSMPKHSDRRLWILRGPAIQLARCNLDARRRPLKLFFYFVRPHRAKDRYNG
jgi:hypothetical protein